MAGHLARERTKHLWAAAHTVHGSFPQLAQHYGALMHNSAAGANIRLADSVSKKFCSKCSTFLLPGVNCSVRLVKAKKRDFDVDIVSRSSQPSGTAGVSEKGKQSVQVKRLVSSSWSDGFDEGKHSRKKNDLVCTCKVCGFSVHWGGSDPAEANRRRHQRGRARRGQRYGDGEKANAALRLENARDVMKKEGLASVGTNGSQGGTGGAEQDGRVQLPSTISQRAAAALDKAYGRGSGASDGVPTTFGQRRSLHEADAQAGSFDAEKRQRNDLSRPEASFGGNKKSLYDMLEGILGGSAAP